MKARRVMLTDVAFRKLVRGEVVELSDGAGDKIEIALQDIGWDRMHKHISDGMSGKGGDGE